MSASEQPLAPPENSLHRVAAAGSVIVGGFLLLGGSGHLVGVQAALERAVNTPGESVVALLLPGLILLGTGLLDMGLVRALWQGHRWALNLALPCNLFTTGYVAFLMTNELPGHPIGAFLALLVCFTLLLAALRAGLSWPAARSTHSERG